MGNALTHTMAATTTINDLPDDMLHEIFGHVFAAELEDELDDEDWPTVPALQPATGTHLALRSVCRRWRDIADWVRLSTATISVETWQLPDAGAVRARHPAALKRLELTGLAGRHSTKVARAAASLINGSADLRRVLSSFELRTCCLPAHVPTVMTVASCTALTELHLSWDAHQNERVVPSNMLAPLSALRTLKAFAYGYMPKDTLSKPALLTPLPALPDAPLQGLVDAEDPFFLRGAFDAGTWQPSRLTGLQELDLTFYPVRRDLRAPARPSRTRSRAGSEWAPLAGQVTVLDVSVQSDGYIRPSTGIVAGLGVLTALRNLTVEVDVEIEDLEEELDPGQLELVSIDRVRAPHLTELACECVSSPANVAHFPNLVDLYLTSATAQSPLNLRSLVARSSLKMLMLAIGDWSTGTCSINLAELFAGGSGWPVLEDLTLWDAVLEWDATGVAGAPTAVEFAQRARQLLPALVEVDIDEPHGRDALPDRSRVGFVLACRRHVVPALEGLRAGGS